MLYVLVDLLEKQLMAWKPHMKGEDPIDQLQI